MELDFDSYQKQYNKYEKIYLNLLEITWKHLGLKCDPIISVSIVDKDLIHKINLEYRKVDRPTDVISFAFLDNESNKKDILTKKGNVILGDIYICADVAKEHAKEYGNTDEREFKFLFVHGILHLLGYDHMKKEDEDVMFPLQEEILQKELKK